jgi:hypothetical protein
MPVEAAASVAFQKPAVVGSRRDQHMVDLVEAWDSAPAVEMGRTVVLRQGFEGQSVWIRGHPRYRCH